MTNHFDLFVIGGGSGGIASARRAASYGAKVGIAEVKDLGGTCVNRGCIPKKLMVYASRFPELIEDAPKYGWTEVTSHGNLDWPTMINAVHHEVARLNGVYQNMLDKSGVTVYKNYARFLDPHTLQVGEEKITADKILIAVGGYPVKPNIPGIEHTIVSDDVFLLPQQPKRIVVLGAGYIGAEFACIMHGLGTEVTQIIRGDKILRGFDEDLRTEIQTAMEQKGIRILTIKTLKAIEKTNNDFKVILDNQEVIVTDAVSLAAIGRKPNLANLGLENASVEIVNDAIAVDTYSTTSQPHIFAVGDCTNNINLTPVAIREGRAFADTHFGGKDKIMSYENVPTAIFTTPEASTVGLSEAKAQEKYGADAIKVYRAKFRPLYHTVTGKEDKVFLKLVVNQNTDQVLGAHMVGEHAGEIIQGVAIAVKMGAKKADFDATVGIHPTIAEEFVTMT